MDDAGPKVHRPFLGWGLLLAPPFVAYAALPVLMAAGGVCGPYWIVLCAWLGVLAACAIWAYYAAVRVVNWRFDVAKARALHAGLPEPDANWYGRVAYWVALADIFAVLGAPLVAWTAICILRYEY
jgi:hypothetical protein